MRFHIVTIFPEIFESYVHKSILGRALKEKKISIAYYNPREYTGDKHRTVDDRPFGGGAGMVFKAEPILKAVEDARKKCKKGTKPCVILLSAKGKQFTQKIAYTWSKKESDIILISTRYEGVDERVKKILRAEELSIGPYVLTDGDVATMVFLSAVTRLLPGVIKFESLQEESHWNTLLKKEAHLSTDMSLEYPHYTRPEVLVWKGKKYKVPAVLRSGHHADIQSWRQRQQKSK